jgi:hypothetical protein
LGIEEVEVSGTLKRYSTLAIMRVIKNLSILSKLSLIVFLELLGNQVTLRELISDLLIVLQDFTALIPIQVNRCLMPRRRG